MTTRPERGPDNSSGRVAVIAGGGRLPVELAATLARSGRAPFVVIAKGEAPDDSELFAYDHAVLAVEDFADLAPLLKRENVGQAVLAGAIARRPHWRAIRWKPALLPIMWRAVKALSRGDDALLKVVVGHLEARGIRVVGAHDILPEILAPAGLLTEARPDKRAMADIDAALAAARAIGALDIGQAAVAVGGRAIALEGIEGTDGLLERVKLMRGHGRIAGQTGGVLVKCAKPGQELRVDLPSIGPATVEAAHAAGLTGIAVESGRSLMLRAGETIGRANALGLFILGITSSEP
jgi:UDP-2,3-diacylglucosamine hydrolase